MEKIRPLVAEFIGTFALIFIGIGAIFNAGHLTITPACWASHWPTD
jgi:glycerol uptake facilitator-like aquaporin